MELRSAANFQRTAWVLSSIGLIPFVLISASMLFFGSDNPIITPAFNYFKLYSVAILSFMGGTRWGYSLRENGLEPETFTLVTSILPTLFAWVILLLPSDYNALIVMILLLCFCAMGAWDSLSASAKKLPRWYAKLRTYMTLAVATCHIVVFFVIGGAA